MLSVSEEAAPRSALALLLASWPRLIDTTAAHPLALEAAAAAMAPATKAALLADLKCYLAWCARQHPPARAIPAAPETLVHYLRWLGKATPTRAALKQAC